MKLSRTGLGLTLVSCAVPVIWLVPVAAERDAVAVFSQYLGIVALITMALTQLIATRLRFVEPLFGGLDSAYVLHKWLGITALVCLLLHDTIDADLRGQGRGGAIVDLAETMGEISLYGLLMLVVITVATFIPYHLWIWTHKVMGTFYAMGAFHYLFIQKAFANGDPLGLYVSAFCVLGILAYLYKLAPAWARPKLRYVLDRIEKDGRATVLEMSPKGKALRHRSGQFAFLRFEADGLRERHPFTISSAPQDGKLRFTIAPLGDFTSRALKQLTAGTEARIEGPFGHFTRKRSDVPDIWIGAGVGITPFAAWAQALEADAPPARLFYCVPDAAAASHLDELREAEARLGGFEVTLHESKSQGRFDAAQVIQAAGDALGRTNVYFCGPEKMREAIGKELRRAGHPSGRFHYEEFEIRTGIGLKALAEWALERALSGPGKRA